MANGLQDALLPIIAGLLQGQVRRGVSQRARRKDDLASQILEQRLQNLQREQRQTRRQRLPIVDQAISGDIAEQMAEQSAAIEQARIDEPLPAIPIERAELSEGARLLPELVPAQKKFRPTRQITRGEELITEELDPAGEPRVIGRAPRRLKRAVTPKQTDVDKLDVIFEEIGRLESKPKLSPLEKKKLKALNIKAGLKETGRATPLKEIREISGTAKALSNQFFNQNPELKDELDRAKKTLTDPSATIFDPDAPRRARESLEKIRGRLNKFLEFRGLAPTEVGKRIDEILGVDESDLRVSAAGSLTREASKFRSPQDIAGELAQNQGRRAAVLAPAVSQNNAIHKELSPEESIKLTTALQEFVRINGRKPNPTEFEGLINANAP